MSLATVNSYVLRWAEVLPKGMPALLKQVRNDVSASYLDQERLRAQAEAFAVILELYMSSSGDQQRELLALIESEAGRQLALEAADTRLLCELRGRCELLKRETQDAVAALGSSRQLLAVLEELQERKTRLEEGISNGRKSLAQANAALGAVEGLVDGAARRNL